MRDFVESIKRLYVKNVLDENKIRDLASCNKITYDEMMYILDK